MSYSNVNYTGTGTTRAFAIPFRYIAPSHIHVTVNGVVTADWTLPDPGSLVFGTAPASGSFIEIARVTPKDTPLVDFEDTSTLTASNLDTSSLQAVYGIQEALDRADRAIQRAGSELAYDALGQRVKHVGTPTASDDAVTKGYVDTAISTASFAGSGVDASTFVQAAGGNMTGTLTQTLSGLKPARKVTHSASGTATNGAFPDFPHAGFAYDYMNITGDNVALDSSQVSIGRGVVLGQAVDYHFGGSAVNGARIAHGAFATMSTPVQANNNSFFGASWHFALSVCPVSGSSPAAPSGNLYAMNPQVQLYTGATNYVSIMGVECDVEVDTGASVQYKWGICITTIGNDATHGSITESALHIGAVPSSGGWNCGIMLSRFNGGGVPISPGGTVMASRDNFAVGHIFDFSTVSVAGYVLNAPGYRIDGVGNSSQSGQMTAARVVTSEGASIGTGLRVGGNMLVEGTTTLTGATIPGPVTITGQLNLGYIGPPASATAPGNLGDQRWDASYLYVCVAPNSWKRVLMAAW